MTSILSATRKSSCTRRHPGRDKRRMALQGLEPKGTHAQIDNLKPTGEPVRLASFGMAISLSQIGLRPCFYVSDDVRLFVKFLDRYEEEIDWLMECVGCQVWGRLDSMPEMSGLKKIRERSSPRRGNGGGGVGFWVTWLIIL